METGTTSLSARALLAGLWGDGALVAAVGSMPIIAVSLVIAVVYGAFGGLLRGVV